MPPKKKGGKKKDDNYNYWDDEFEQDAQALGIINTESNQDAPVLNDDNEPDFMAQIAKAANKKSKKKDPAPPPVDPTTDERNDTAEDTPRIKTKKEKEREKKERQKEQKKLQSSNNKGAQQPVNTSVVATEPVTTTTTTSTAPKADNEEDDAEPTGGNKKKKKGKKSTAEKEEPPSSKGKRKGPPVAALKQMLEAQRAAEEAAQKEQEELERQEEERIKKEEEEERRKEEIKQRKKEKEKAKREQLRKEGKLLTKAQKEAQQHAEIRKQQLLESGAVKIEALEEKEENKPKKVVYGNKKKKGGKDKNAEELERKKAEEERKRLEEEEAKKITPAEEVKESWENSEDELDVEGVKDSWDMSSDEEEEPTKTEEIAEAEDVKAENDDDDDDDNEDENDDDDDEDDSEDDDSSDDDEEETAAGRENTRRKEEAKRRREERHANALAARTADDLRSPICVILGHVDTGKTKLLDKIRQTNVQEGEAGGITQQIGATYFPIETIKQKTEGLTKDKDFDFKVPGLLVIDTPGHESFTNLRSRGSSLCNIAVLVVDIMHGLEPQTIESIKLLRDRKTPFIVALNKIDRIYGWEPTPNGPFLESLAKQPRHVKVEFEDRVKKTNLAFAEQGLNSILYYENKNFARNVSLVPTSAITGEGIPDLLMLLIDLTQSRMSDKLMYISELECTVLEVKVIEGLGTTIDVILSNGVINEGDRIVVCGLNGPIVTNIRALLTPQPLKEMRVKSAYVHHKSIKAAQGIKICAPDLERAVAGSRLLVVGPDDDEDEMKDDIMGDLQDLMSSVDKSGQGVCVQASTLGSLEALLEFLKCSEIPVSGISIGPVHKRDVIRASTMLEKAKEFAVMLCFDVKIDREAQDLADELGIKIFKADIIYHLFDAFTAYKKDLDEQKRKDSAPQAVFPCVCRMIPGAIFNKKDPIVIGLDVIEGALRVGTPLAVLKMNPITQQKEVVTLGKVSSMEMNHKNVDVVKKGQAGGGVAVKIEGASYESSRVYGRHFDDKDMLYSRITRQSIDVLKENFRNDMSKEDWAVIIQLKKVLGI